MIFSRRRRRSGNPVRNAGWGWRRDLEHASSLLEARILKPHPTFAVDLILISVTLIWGMNFSVMKGLFDYFDPHPVGPLYRPIPTADPVNG